MRRIDKQDIYGDEACMLRIMHSHIDIYIDGSELVIYSRSIACSYKNA